MAFDEARQVTVLFGGYDRVLTEVGDTWTWDGQVWLQHTPTQNPPARSWGTMVFDSQRDKIVMFGGYTGAGGSYLNDTWEWDGQDWSEVSPAVRPPVRAIHALAYDASRGRVVLFGGHSNGPRFNDTWEFDGNNWQQMTPATTPGPRAHHAMAYDPVRQTVVLFGGWEAGSYLADTWEWDGTTWTSLPSNGAPAPRGNHEMVFQSSRSTLLFYGGNTDGGGTLSDTWEGSFALPTFTEFGTGCGGAHGVPTLSLTPGMEPSLGGTFGIDFTMLPPGQMSVLLVGASNTLLGGASLPIPLDVAGMPGCSLHVSGEIALPLANPSGSAPWQTAIPSSATLLGITFYLQGLVDDPAANAAGLIASAGGAVTVGT